MLRRLWVLDGVLEHGISLDLLEEIVEKYERIDAVPNHYYQAEFFTGILAQPNQLGE